jgi:serine/threonine protein kinase
MASVPSPSPGPYDDTVTDDSVRERAEAAAMGKRRAPRGGERDACTLVAEPGPAAHDGGPERRDSGRRDPRGSDSVQVPMFGRYRIDKKIGSGGMGVVYRAYDPMLERTVALKVVRPTLGGKAAQRRLFREAQALAKVRHPNVVAIHDVGVLGRDVFIAMEYVPGQTVTQWLAESARSTEEILGVFRAAGAGLAAAHRAGLVHRDFKRSNVIVGEDGRVQVIDFGLARPTEGESSGERALASDEGGTPSYLPGELAAEVTQAWGRAGTLP